MKLLLACAIAIATTSNAISANFLEKSSQSGESYLLLEGDIVRGDAERLEELLVSGRADSRLIAFNSPGGSLWEGVLLGTQLRYRGFSTYVRPNEKCLSACMFAFIGGERRTVYPGGELGGHQFYGGTDRSTSQSATQYSTSQLFKFSREMGVSVEAMEIASSTPPDDMHVFSPDELSKFNLNVPHKRETFSSREARKLKIPEKEYLRRWAEFVSADKSSCEKETSITADVCMFRLMSEHGIPR